jgi:hypothetical protein
MKSIADLKLMLWMKNEARGFSFSKKLASALIGLFYVSFCMKVFPVDNSFTYFIKGIDVDFYYFMTAN